MSEVVQFFFDVTLVITMIAVGLTIIRLLLFTNITVAQDPYSDETNEAVDYFMEKLEERRKPMYMVVHYNTQMVLVFDTATAVFKTIWKDGFDESKHVLIFTKEELNDFGYTDDDDEYMWISIIYDCEEETRKDDVSANN